MSVNTRGEGQAGVYFKGLPYRPNRRWALIGAEEMSPLPLDILQVQHGGKPELVQSSHADCGEGWLELGLCETWQSMKG